MDKNLTHDCEASAVRDRRIPGERTRLAATIFAGKFAKPRRFRPHARRVRSPERGVARGYTRERRRPELRVYFIGLRFGSILDMPVPLFTSMI
jgi:hypothetical protein